ncbi:MAG: hypothetical protein M3Q36_01900 [bacterium]|nr:hypothetical protein [bacterium]
MTEADNQHQKSERTNIIQKAGRFISEIGIVGAAIGGLGIIAGAEITAMEQRDGVVTIQEATPTYDSPEERDMHNKALLLTGAGLSVMGAGAVVSKVGNRNSRD